MIRAREVRLIDETGANVGVVTTVDALERAAAAGVDLVEISPDANPPVCKIMDYGKFKYQEQKKAAEARKNQKVVELKEIKMRPSIDDHDYDVKMRSMRRFFEEGDKVKVTLRFRGREMAHQELGMNVLKRVKVDIESFAKVLSERNRELLAIIALNRPQSLSELEVLSGRAKSNLSRTLHTMARYGLVELKKGGRGSIVPAAAYDQVELAVDLTAAWP